MLGDDHSSHSNFSECPANFRSPWCDDTRGLNRAGCPSSVLSCTAWGFSCLANCSASGELLPRLFTLACTLLPKNRRYFFCDTLRHRSFSTVTPACFTRRAAVWCSDFPPASRKQLASDHLPSPNNLSQPARKKREPKSGRMKRR